jgi:YD repeat-containing protein
MWLITRYGTFRKFDLYRSATGLYDRVSPTDETRKLKKTATGWELRSLDGTVQVFNTSGLWQSTRDRFGNTKTATYSNGRLASVTMPDGRSETFGYHASGKLASSPTMPTAR